MKNDIEVLSGRFGNRRGTTEDELSAANYLYNRFKTYSPFTYLDSFLTIESFFLLLAMYYAEFLLIAIVGIWASRFAMLYGIFVFVAYLIESSGVRLFSRLFPLAPAESQHVVAPFHVEKPKRLIIVTAGYDTQVNGLISPLLRSGYTAWAHRGVLLLMVVIIVSLPAQSIPVFVDADLPWLSILRWCSVASLLGIAMTLYVHEHYGDDVRGANNNASGVSTLLSIGEELQQTPLEHSDIWLVALGNSYGSQEGIRQLLESTSKEASETYLINVQGVGAGELHYLSSEGLMSQQAYKNPLVAIAKDLAPEFTISPSTYHGFPTPASWPNQHKYAALSIMGLTEDGETAHAWSDGDRHHNIDEATLQRATAFTRKLVRHLDASST